MSAWLSAMSARALVEGALHRAQRPEPAERRRPRVAVGGSSRIAWIRRLASSTGCQPRRSSTQSQLVATPSRKREPAARACFAASAELLLGVERRRSVPVERRYDTWCATRWAYASASSSPAASRTAIALRASSNIPSGSTRRGAPEREVEASDLEPSVRALVARGRGSRGLVEHPRGIVALVDPAERVGEGGGELDSAPARRLGATQPPGAAVRQSSPDRARRTLGGRLPLRCRAASAASAASSGARGSTSTCARYAASRW